MVFGTLFGVFVFSVVVRVAADRCPLWASVYECQRVECAFTSPVRTECDIQRYSRVSSNNSDF